MEEIKISKKTADFAEKNRMGIDLLAKGVVYICYQRGIYSEGYFTAALVSKLKEDNPLLMVTALTVIMTSTSSYGAIVNFEERR